MRRDLFALWPLLAMLLILAVGLPAHATTSCTAGNPNTTSLIESTPTSDFAPFGAADVTVTHNKTGLMWKRCAEGLSGASCATGAATTMTWANALKAANTTNTAAFAGYTDWRLPNEKELNSIVEFCGYNPSINQTAFPATPPALFWSGSSYVPNPADAWDVFFGSGFTNANYKANSYYVRLVRGGQSVDAFDLLKPYIDITPILMLLLF
jgi:hypothetical protein